MGKIGKNLIGNSDLPPFFEVDDNAASGVDAPGNRLGDAYRTCVRTLSGFQKEALVTSATDGRTWRLVSDEGAYLNGHDAAPCPLAFVSVGMVASFMNEIQALAQIREISLRGLKLVQNSYYTMTGSMLKRTMTGGAEPVELHVVVDCDLSDTELNGLLSDAIAASPVYALVRQELESAFLLSKNGSALPTMRVPALEASLLDDPVDRFNQLRARPSIEILVEQMGPTPRKQVDRGTARQGSSLSEQQDRRLNIGAVARLREDGMKEIQQMQYSPYGTSFRFLSEEHGVDDEPARAPGAMTYLSAGIGFCFMTQFGRFVSILDLDLPGYRITQDTHFSLGGASGGTGTKGDAGKVETHVFLDTPEPDEVAKEMLDISEQTCFLHALCKTPLRVKLSVERS